MPFHLHSFNRRVEASAAAAKLAASGLRDAIDAHQHARLMASGGTSPAGLYDALSQTDLPWERVIVGLVDERWVSPDDEASNEGLVRRALLHSRAGAAGFLPMKTHHETAAEAVADRARAYAAHTAPIDVLVLGMGNDGHTASWFPGSRGLDAAVSLHAAHAVVAIDATGCEVAGDHTERMTLTAPAICGAQMGIMILFGEEKRDVLQRARHRPDLDWPVSVAIHGLRDRLSIFWAP